ncbi:hypothetical protein R3W88_023427 [Solanum pinnatisectum]|uniref:Endonuclease/exonuclease/phosphatase domain-containing protein n=1 Tax=Solanum pinnatisectum TaxID=50273 RepID=A0AAV9LZM1_9SOLN|nr:hypothetical protein R3W88_023427 [Solanum pinnatisectum]
MIDKILFWNIKSVKSQNAFERVIELHRRHHYSYIALIFWDDSCEEEGSSDTTQQLTMNFKISGTQDRFDVTTVYARCSALERLELWEDLECMTSQSCPWLVGGDFNTIVDDSEKLGGLPLEDAELSKSNVDLKRFMKIEEEFWKQKAGMRWFKDGDKNTKFFHAYVNGRRK